MMPSFRFQALKEEETGRGERRKRKRRKRRKEKRRGKGRRMKKEKNPCKSLFHSIGTDIAPQKKYL